MVVLRRSQILTLKKKAALVRSIQRSRPTLGVGWWPCRLGMNPQGAVSAPSALKLFPG